MDHEFEPKLGRIRAPRSRRGGRYLSQLLAATMRAGGLARSGGRRFSGERTGRGAAIGRVLGSSMRDRSRRAIVKTRLVRLGARGAGAARAHLRYIQRDGVQRDGSPGSLYSADREGVDGRDFLGRCEGDRHQFRFIVSAEDGDQYEDLKPLTRRLMAQMEKDLGTRLDWVAVDHLDTAHPHTHIMLRGRDERGENLVIAREYISRGMRQRASAIVTLDLGPRTDLEIDKRLRRDLGAERLTATDRSLLRSMDSDRRLAAGHRDPFQHALRAGRLKKLEALGLAHPLPGDRWQMAEDVEERLRRLGERGDIVRTLQRALSGARLERGPSDRVIHQKGLGGPVTGRLIARGLLDEQADRHFLIVDGVDGRVHHIDIGRGDATGALADGAVVRIEPATAPVRPADRNVASVAAASGGRYSVDLHLAFDPAASRAFADAHVRRLEAIRRATGAVERMADGSWVIGPDHLRAAERFESRRLRDRPVRTELLSPLPLERLMEAGGATWLDRLLVGEEAEPLRDGGFGREVKGALAARRQWLLGEQLAEETGEETRYRRNLLVLLQRRELIQIVARLERELDMPHLESEPGMHIAGRLDRRLDLASGRFALIAGSRSFTLVPWRDELARHQGRDIQVRPGAGGISWSIGRGRSGPEIG
jgi:type IV secretory pathway VirD2 relaxase